MRARFHADWSEEVSTGLRLLGAAGLLVAAWLVLSSLFTGAMAKRFDEQLLSEVRTLAAGAELKDGAIAAPPPADSATLRARSGVYWQVSTVGSAGQSKLIGASRSLWNDVLIAPPAGLRGARESSGQPVFYDAVGPMQERLRLAAIEVPSGGARLLFITARDRRGLGEEVAAFQLKSAITLTGFGLGLAALFLLRRTSRPERLRTAPNPF